MTIASLAAILVVFADDARPAAAIDRLLSVCERVVTVDNTLDGHPAVQGLERRAGVDVVHHRNVGGLAGAYNAAIAHLQKVAAGVTHIVFVDDDSDTGILDALLADAHAKVLLSNPSTAAVAPAHRDRATGMRAVHLQIGRFSVRPLVREIRGPQRVSVLINSMSVWRLAAIDAIGPYNESLGVDYVDVEYCLRAQAMGFELHLLADHEFAHSIGRRRTYRLLGRTLQACNYGPERHFAIGRNATWMIVGQAWRMPSVSLIFCMRLLQDALGIVCAEDDRRHKLVRLLAGVWAGLWSRPKQAVR